MTRSKNEIEDMYDFLAWASTVNLNGSKRTENAINNIQCAIDEVEQEIDEVTLLQEDLEHWANKAIQLEKENERLKKELNEYGKENKKTKNT
jgi:cell shape-determining protein MreC